MRAVSGAAASNSALLERPPNSRSSASHALRRPRDLGAGSLFDTRSVSA
jgi:hypothetical protein